MWAEVGKQAERRGQLVLFIMAKWGLPGYPVNASAVCQVPAPYIA